MRLIPLTCTAFVEALASSSPTPGGGGAAALVGAIGTALGRMVAALTVGKAKYAAVAQELSAREAECAALQAQLLDCIGKDAEAFAPLAAAYRLPKDDPNRPQRLEDGAKAACQVPLEIMALAAKALNAIQVFAEKGSMLAISDAACGAVCCKAALESGALNVWINTRSMTDRAYAEKINRQAQTLLEQYTALADGIYSSVAAQLQQPK